MRVNGARPSVLMVTGAYYPELSGGGLQARSVIRALRHDARFSVLTTTIDPQLPGESEEDGVPVRRVFVDADRRSSRLLAVPRLAAAFLRAARGVDVVNVHGFSQKSILLGALSRALRKPFILTLQTGVHDEPSTVRQMGPLAYWAYTNADLYLSVSPGLSRAYREAHLPESRLRDVCNAVDTDRFRPADDEERARLRSELGLPQDVPIVLFVGFFSRDKRPDLLLDAWLPHARASALVYIGATRSSYLEVDRGLADGVRARIREHGLDGRVVFVESTLTIERYYRACDVYVLPSIREGLPIALLEAMSCGLACIATRLPGSTDAIIDPGVSGLLAAPDDRAAFTAAIGELTRDRGRAGALGRAARQTVLNRYSIARTAPLWLAAYKEAAARRLAPAA